MNCLLEDVPLERPACAPRLDDPAAGTWFIAFTKSNRHYDFVKLADRAGIEYFLPMAERVRTDADGTRRVTSYPLYGPYCFFRGTEFTPAEALGTHMLRGIVRVQNQAQLRSDLANVERLLNAKGGRRIERCDFAVTGKLVRVTNGPFENVIGKVIRRGKDTILIISVEGIMGAAAVDVEIDASKLEAVPDPEAAD